MTDKNRMPLRELSVVGISCLALIACSPKQGEFGDQFFPHAKWEQIPPAPDNMVEVVTLRHVVAFPGNQAGLDLNERTSLDDFIRSNRINARDQIELRAGARDGGRMTMGRLSAVRNEFAQYGLVASEAGTPATGALASDEVAVMITRAVVIPPDCSVPQPEPTLRPDHKFGCHVNSALGMMVADPLDLVEGRELGPADGEQASGALRRYREDKVKEITKEDTTN